MNSYITKHLSLAKMYQRLLCVYILVEITQMIEKFVKFHTSIYSELTLLRGTY